MTGIHKSYEDYTVGWITALSLELSAAEAVLDEKHEPLSRKPGDQNTYTLGEIKGHNVVITCLPSGLYGNNWAALVASQMTSTFPQIRYGLLVGIAGGAPRIPGHDIRLGDVVVGQPTSTQAAVIQYDFGKTVAGGVFQRTGSLSTPPSVLLTALSKLQSNHKLGKSQVSSFLEKLRDKRSGFGHPGPDKDRLFLASYCHSGKGSDCHGCDPLQVVERPERGLNAPVIHYGTIGTGNQVMKDAQRRDTVAKQDDLLCFEMEAAGIVNHIPSLVIRGICDYSDTHKNKEWQDYAAATAAAYAKDFLSVLSPSIHIENRLRIAMDLKGVPAIDEFIGRRVDRDNLWKLLQPRVSNSRKIVVLHGISGIGKTQLALRFIRDHKDDFTAVFWINAQSQETVVQSLSSMHLPRHAEAPATDEPTNEEEMEKKAMDVIRWLAIDGNSKWLLVFDGLEQSFTVEKALNIQKYFPTADQGSILLTTNTSHTRELGHHYRLDKLDAEDATKLLTHTACSTAEQRRSPDFHDLLARLDGHPQAITIARSFMNETGATPAECLQQYSTFWQEEERAFLSSEPHSGRNVRSAWMLPFEATKTNRPIAFKLLLLLSCFDRQDIWPELIRGGVQDEASPTWYVTIASGDIEFHRTMRELLRFSLLDKLSEDKFSMHPVVQMWCQRYMLDHDRDEILSIALTSIGLCIPEEDKPEAWEWQRSLPHANRIFQLAHRNHNLSLGARLLHASKAIGDLFIHYGKLKKAEIMYERALDGYKVLNSDNLDLLNTLDKLGLVHQAQGKYSKAEEIYLEVLAQKEKRLGESDPSTLDTIQHLASLYESQGKGRIAEKMYLKALEGKEKKLDMSHPSTLSTMDKLGRLYFNRGDMKSALTYYQRAYQGYRKKKLISSMVNTANNLGLLDMEQGNFEDAARRHFQVVDEIRKTLGDEHPSICNAIENIGLLHTKQGNFEKAHEYLFESLARRTQILGSEHHSIMITRDNIASFYVSQGKLDEAEEQYQQALECGERTVGLSNTTTLRILNNLGNLRYSQGRFKDAEENFIQAMDGYQTALGPTHTATLSVITNLGSIYRMRDERDKAEEMYQRALTGYKDSLNEEHPSTLDVMNNLGLLYADQGRFKEAEDQLVKCKAGREKSFGIEHPSTLGVIDNLGFLQYNQGRLKEAELLIQQSLAGWEAIGDRQNILETMSNRGMVCTALGQFYEAMSNFQQSLKGLMDILDPEHPLILEVQHNLGLLFFEQGAMKESRKKLQEALEGREKILGRRHTSTLDTVLSLANVFRVEGEFEEARTRYMQVTSLLQETLGPDHLSTLQAMCQFGVLHIEEHNLSEAEAKISRALDGLQATNGGTQLSTARAMVQMGRVREGQGRAQEAREMYSKAHSTLDGALGKDHREVVFVADRLRPLEVSLGQRRHRQLTIISSIPVLIGACVYLARIIGWRRRRHMWWLGALLSLIRKYIYGD